MPTPIVYGNSNTVPVLLRVIENGRQVNQQSVAAGGRYVHIPDSDFSSVDFREIKNASDPATMNGTTTDKTDDLIGTGYAGFTYNKSGNAADKGDTSIVVLEPKPDVDNLWNKNFKVGCIITFTWPNPTPPPTDLTESRLIDGIEFNGFGKDGDGKTVQLFRISVTPKFSQNIPRGAKVSFTCPVGPLPDRGSTPRGSGEILRNSLDGTQIVPVTLLSNV